MKLYTQQILFLRSNASFGLSFRFDIVSVVYTIASVNEFRYHLNIIAKHKISQTIAFRN